MRSWLKRMRAVFVTMLFGPSCCLPYFLHHCTYQINHCHWKKIRYLYSGRSHRLILIPFASQNRTSSYPGWIKSPHVVTLGILKLSGGGYSGVNFGQPKSEVFWNGGGVFRSKLWSTQIWSFPKWGGYSRVNFGQPKSWSFPKWGGGVYSGVNFGQPKSEVFRNGGVFWSKLWSSQIWSFPKWGGGGIPE